MNFLHVNFENEVSILQGFDQIAEKISKGVLFRVNKAYYRILDFEFYCFGEKFNDPHTYKNDLQLELGKIYLHASGLDITFGDGVNHGGVLIRSVVKLYEGAEVDEGHMKKQFDGPQIVATELFTGLHSVVDPPGMNEIALLDIDGYQFDSMFHKPVALLKTKRVGLAKKLQDPDDKFMNMSLRYIVVLKKFPNFKQVSKGWENIVEEYVKSGKMTDLEAKEILGYNRKF